MNGDKIVTNMLDEQIMIIDDEEEESDVEYKKVSLDYNCLFDQEQEIDNILKDILDLPIKNISEENCHRFHSDQHLTLHFILKERKSIAFSQDFTSSNDSAFYREKMVED